MWDLALFGLDVYVANGSRLHKHTIRTSEGVNRLVPEIDHLLDGGLVTMFVFDGQFHSQLALEVNTTLATSFATEEAWAHPRPEGPGLKVWVLSRR